MQINQTINSLEVDNEKKNLVLENLEANINFLKKETQSLETQLKEKVFFLSKEVLIKN